VERHGDYNVVIVSRHRQLVTQVFHERATDRLIEAVLVTAYQGGQGAGFVLRSSAVASDRARDSVARRIREASCASGRVIAGGLEGAAANFASRIRHQLDSRDASSTNAASRFMGEWRAARGASRRVKKIQNLAERGHI
jgi:hypothetical protein